MSILILMLLASPIHINDIDVSSEPLTKQEEVDYKKAKFSQIEDIMLRELDDSWNCRVSFNEYFAFWECFTEEDIFGTLFIFQDGEWAKLPGTFTP